MLSKLVGAVFQTTLRVLPKSEVAAPVNDCLSITTPWSVFSIRNSVRYHFPRPSERRRVLRHGWKARMATLGGRKCLMRRILKGRLILSH